MDVVVAPVTDAQNTWLLHDRLGRPLGEIRKLPNGEFFLLSAPNSPLAKLHSSAYVSLDVAMLAIEREMRGACQLSESAAESKV